MAIYLLYVMSPVIVWILMNIINTKSINYDDRRKKNYIIICGIIMALMIDFDIRESAQVTLLFITATGK